MGVGVGVTPAVELITSLEWVLSRRLCMRRPRSSTCCRSAAWRPLLTCRCRGHRHAGCSFQSLLHSRLDSHRCLDSTGGLPRQCQPLSGRGCGNPPGTCRLLGSQRRSRRGPDVPKEESTAEQQRRGPDSTRQKSCITMEVMVNAVMLSTDRAWTGFEINPGPQRTKGSPFRQAGEGIEPSL